MSVGSPPPVPPAWYPDPVAPAYVRWYDGARWTEHVMPAYPAYAPYPPYAASQQWSSPGHRDRLQEALLPVNRRPLAIAAGYAGLFAVLLLPAPVALALGVMAVIDLGRHPGVAGLGRAWFGVVMGLLGTIGLVALIAGN